jgi:ABC-type sugar transport system ATPase subunit
VNAVEFRDVTKTYHLKRVLETISFAIQPETFTVLFGMPGCGKTTVLRLLTGLEEPTEGTIMMRGEDVTRVAPAQRNIGYVPQSFALYPHYRVYDNIAYPLRLMGTSKPETDQAVRRVAEMLHIDRLLQKRPDQLSGGEKQRVALARGIVKKTDIYAFDDPLSGLDYKLREQLFDDLRRLQEELHATFVYTTSDPLEAMMMAVELVVLDAGRVIETGRLEQVYAMPKHVRTMALLGFPRTNLLEGVLESRGKEIWCTTTLFDFPVRLTGPAAAGQNVAVTIRPQDLIVNPEKINGSAEFRAKIVLREDLGGELVIYLDANGLQMLSVIRHDDAQLLADENVNVAVMRNSIVLYAAEMGQSIGRGAA